MSQENVEIVRRMSDAFQRGRLRGDRRHLMTRDVDGRWTRTARERGSRKSGRSSGAGGRCGDLGRRRSTRGVIAARRPVLARPAASAGRERAAGGDRDATFAIFTLATGKVIAEPSLPGPAEALEAAGLSE